MPRDAVTGQFVPGPWSEEEHAARARSGHRPNAGSFGAPGRPGGHPVAPVGTERIDTKSGEVFVKVAAPSPYAGRTYRAKDGHTWTIGRHGHWKPRRLVVFEAAHGPVPPGCIVRRLMPDPLDDDLDNLVLVTKSVNATLNSGHWCKPRRPWSTIPPDPELRLAVVQAALADQLSRKRRKGAW